MLSLFFKIDRSTLSLDPEALDGQNTLFDVGRSMFDVRRSLVSFTIRLAVFLARGRARVKRSLVSFPIKLAAFQASGGAEHCPLKPDTQKEE